jgi:protein tyrosine phosphatase (PTP) superfamily phosphohydrolase (DUF442 family)
MRYSPGLKSTLAAIATCLCLISCQSNRQTAPPAQSQSAANLPAAPQSPNGFLTPVPDQIHLVNARYVTPKVISGAQPEGDAPFQVLRDLGIKTIISVDGAKPDVATAHKFGMTYVHLPITYSGVTPDEGKAIAKALQELPGPIYIHCHHGKHRSAAAVTVACVLNGTLAPDKAETVLKTFGTGENYTGLWQAARDARPLPPGVLQNFHVQFVETTPLPPLADAMVSVDQRWDHIKTIQSAGWKTPPDNPDLDPPHEALQLNELFQEVPRADATPIKSTEFARLINQAIQNSEDLHKKLAATPIDPTATQSAFTRVNETCAACHKLFRDKSAMKILN